MSAKVSGIQNFSRLDDVDKVYMLKLIAILVGAILSGIISGSVYEPGTRIAWIGFSSFFILFVGTSYAGKFYYNLELTNVQLLRQGIFLLFVIFIFFWVVIFNFVYLARIN